MPTRQALRADIRRLEDRMTAIEAGLAELAAGLRFTMQRIQVRQRRSPLDPGPGDVISLFDVFRMSVHHAHDQETQDDHAPPHVQ